MSEERFTEDLDPEIDAPSDAAARVRGYLADDAMWDEPDPTGADTLVGLIGARAAQARSETGIDEDNRRPLLFRPAAIWLGSAAVLALIALGAFALVSSQANDPEGIELALQGTELAPAAHADAEVITTDAGYAIRLHVEGLPPAPAGSFYQGWVEGDDGSVAIGTFHLRGDAPIGLWSGVDVADYPTINITLQDEGAGPESSGEIVLTGEIPSS